MNYENRPEPLRTVKKIILKNLIVICVAFLGVFTAFQAISALQTNILSANESLGDYALITIYCSLVISSLLSPGIVIERLGCKWTLVIGQIPYCIYIATMLKPTLFICLPAAVLVGLAAAPLWTAKCEYLCHLSERYALISKVNLNYVYSAFFGCYFMAFLSTGLWGNLIYYLITNVDLDHNASMPPEGCGQNYITYSLLANISRDQDNSNYMYLSNSNSYLLISTYLSIGIVSVLVLAVYIDSISIDQEGDKCWSRQLSCTLRHFLGSSKQWMIVPLTLWSGIEQGFFTTLFAEAFVLCPFGATTHAVAMMIFGLCGSISAILGGLLRRKVALSIIFMSAAVINYIVLILTMAITLNSKAAVYTCVVLWAIAEGIWQSQIGVLYAELFPANKIGAFSNYRLWESLGFILVYLLKMLQIHVAIVTYLLMVILIFGMTGYLIMEVLYKNRSLSSYCLQIQSSESSEDITDEACSAVL